MPYTPSSPLKSIITQDVAESPNTHESKIAIDANIALIKDSIGSIKKSTLRFFSGTALSRVTGMLRDVLLAFAFGTHAAVAAFFVAFRLSHVCRRLFGEGALQSAFIPIFEELRKDSPERAFRFFRDLSALLTIFLTGFVLVSMAGLGVALRYIEWSPGNAQIIKLMIILMPSLLPICLFGINCALLQCQKHYFTAGIAPAFFNIIITLGVLILHYVYFPDPVDAMPYLAVATVIGCGMQWFATFTRCFRHTQAALQGKLTQSINFLSSDIRKLVAPLSLGLLGVGASQINNAIDALFARWADPEGPAQLWYGLRLTQLPLALFGIAISGALLPPLSRAIQAGNTTEYLSFLDFAIRRVTALLLPCTIALYVLGTHLINLIFGHGDFQMHSIITTTSCLHGYAMGLLPMGLIIVLAPAFYAHKDYKTPMIGACISLVINALLDSSFVFIFGMKALSVALATSVASWCNVLFLYRALEKKSGRILTEVGGEEFFKIVAISFFAGAVTWFLQTRFFTPATFFHFFTIPALPTVLLDQIKAVALSGCTFLGCILLFAFTARSHDLLGLFRLKPTRSPATLQE